MGIYRMSEAGGCPRALAAARLDYDPIPDRRDPSLLFKEGRRHEIHIAEDLAEEGYELEDAGECMQCRDEFGETGIGGHHIEINTPLIRLLGHVDRYLIIGDRRYPCEFKSMGLFPFQKFMKEGLTGYPGYQAQVACYIGFSQAPALYVVKNRDNGKMDRFTIPYGKEILEGHTVQHIPITLDQIIDKLNLVEAFVRTGELPDGVEATECQWCSFRFLCSEGTGETEEKESMPETTETELMEAADLWKEGKKQEAEAKGNIEFAKGIFLQHAQSKPKFRVGGVSVSYSGSRTRKTLDEKMLRELVDPSIIKKAERTSKPYDDIRIKALEEK